MKTKNILIAAVTACTLGGIATSCSDSFLDEKVYSKYTPDSINDENGLEAVLKGLYRTYGTLWSESGHQGWLACWQIGTDVATAGQIEGSQNPFFQYGQLVPDVWGVQYPWEILYKVIDGANTVIAQLDGGNLSMADDIKKRGLAEAKFWRGYCYNYLATLYGGVPLLTEPVNTAKTDLVRAPLADINSLVENDLKVAMADLPEVGAAKSESRANKYMAMQVLGEAYLRMNRGGDAETVLKQITGSSKYSLVKSRYGVRAGQAGDYYSDMFVYGNQRRSQGNTETIWTYEVENPKQVVGGETGASQHRRVWVPAYHDLKIRTASGDAIGMQICDTLGGRGLGRLRLSYWLTHRLYKEGDIRNSQYSIHRDFYMNNPNAGELLGQYIKPTSTDTVFNNMPYCTKWNAMDLTDEYGWNTVKDWPMMRLGETYLLLAEACLLQGNKQGAADAINVLRERAFSNYPAEGKVTADQIDMNFILDERARELIGEENRRYTLMRTKTLVERAKLNTDKCNPITGLKEYHMLLPIPLREIQLNKDAVLEQNPGY